MLASGARLGDRLRVGVALLAVMVPVAVLWEPVRDAYFHGDDFLHLYDYTTQPLRALIGESWGGHVLGLYHVVFWSAFKCFGTDPRGYYTAIVALHAVNTALVLVVVRRVTANLVLGLLGALLWGLCPVLAGTLAWISVQGEVVLTTIVLLVLASMAHWWNTPGTIPLRTVLGWVIMLALGSTAFGMGLGIAAAFPVAAVLAFGPRRLGAGRIALLAVGAGATVAGYAILLHAGAPRENDVLTAALDGSLLIPLRFLALLFSAGAGALLLAPFGVAGAPAVDDLAAVAFLATAAAGLATQDLRVRRVIVVTGVLVLAVYGSVSMGRAIVYEANHASIVAMARESRYHYLPLALLSVMLCAALRGLAETGRVAGSIVLVCAGVWFVARGAAFAAVPVAIPMRAGERAEQELLVQTVWDEVRRTPPGAIVWIQNRPFRAMPLAEFMPGWAGMYVVLFPENVLAGHQVRFLTSQTEWELAQKRGGRIAALTFPRGLLGKPRRAP